MKFNNIRKNILYYIGDTVVLQRKKASLTLSNVYASFADIPQKNIKEAVESLENKDLISLSAKTYSITLTDKGLIEFHQL
jgi:hypothetical protein